MQNKKIKKIISILVLAGLAGGLLFNSEVYSPVHKDGVAAKSQKISSAAPNSSTPSTDPPAVPVPADTVVKLASEDIKSLFLIKNNLSPSDLKPVADLANTYLVNRPANDLIPSGAVISAQRQYRALFTPSDPIYPQWYSNIISAPAAWDISTGSNTITVAVIDTGFGLNHTDLDGRWDINSGEYGATALEGPAPNCTSQSLSLDKYCNNRDDDNDGRTDNWRGWDFAHEDNNPSAGSTNPSGAGVAHGTLTAGLVGATGNNGTGVASINWGAKILPLQALDDDGIGTTVDVASAIHYAVNQGAKVISLSLGSTAPDPILKTELDYAQSNNVVVVAAAGNCGDPDTYVFNDCSQEGQTLYPANYPQVLAVGATNSTDTRASFSSFGPNLDVMAPGIGTLRSPAWTAGNQTSLYSANIAGTSFSAPIVAGLAALYQTTAPSATVNEVTSAIIKSADKVSAMNGKDFTNDYGYGRINAEGTLRWASITHPSGTLIIDSNNTVYKIENGTKRSIPDPPTFLSYYKDILSQAKPATPSDLALPNGLALPVRSGALVKGSGLEQYVLADNSGTLSKFLVPDIQTLKSLGYSSTDLITGVSDSYLQSLPSASNLSSSGQHPNGTLIMAPDKTTVYLIENNLLRHVPHPYVLMTLNHGKASMKSATSADMALAAGANLDYEEGSIVKSSSPAAYQFTNQSGTIVKRYITSPFVFKLLHYTDKERLTVPDSVLPANNGTDIN